MALFDKEKLLQNIKSKGLNKKTRLAKLETLKSISIIVDWCNHKNINIELSQLSGGIAHYDVGENEIVIDSRLKLENMLYALLHECGHVLIGRKKPHERFGMGYSADTESAGRKSATHKLDIIDEEFEAWHRGRKLAKRLGVKINKVDYDRLKAKCMKNYLRWALGLLNDKTKTIAVKNDDDI